MLPHNAYNQLKSGKNVINLKDDNRPLSHKMLSFPYRDFVIFKVKAPLQKVIETATRISQVMPAVMEAVNKIRTTFGGVTKENTRKQNTHLLLEHKQRLLNYEDNPGRIALLSSVYDLIAAENEHDIYYDDRLNVALEFIIEDILNGKWQPRVENHPHQYWKEPKPYGGKYSIIAKIQKHRQEILKLIGEA